MNASELTTVHHPTHYVQDGQIECIAAIKASMSPEEFIGYLRGNTFKYLWRFRHKGGLEDLRKGNVYYLWLIEAYVEFRKKKGIPLNGREDPVSSA